VAFARFWLFFTCAFLALVGHVSAAEDAPVCRVFLPKSLVNDSRLKVLAKLGYHIEISPATATPEDMDQFLDVGVALDKDQKLAYWVQLASHGYSQKFDNLLRDDLSDLPSCRRLPDVAANGYFNLAIGGEARHRLDAFYSKGVLTTGLGDLILKAEALRIFGIRRYWSAFQQNKLRYDNLVKEVRRVWRTSKATTIPAKVDDVRKLLFPYYKNYSVYFNYMSLLLDPTGFGSCQANTQLILATLIDAEVDLGPDYEIGAQLFIDHVQPILIEKKTGRLIDMTSATLSSRKAPVYSPELITFAIARAAGRAMYSEREFALLVQKMDWMKMDPIAAFMYYGLDLREDAPSPWDTFGYLRFDKSLSYQDKGVPPPPFAEMDFSSIADPSALQSQDAEGNPIKQLTEQANEQMDGDGSVGSGINGKNAIPGSAKTRSGGLNGKAQNFLNRLLEEGAATKEQLQDFEAKVANRGKATAQSSSGISAGVNEPNEAELKILNQKYWSIIDESSRPDADYQMQLTRSNLYASTDAITQKKYCGLNSAFRAEPSPLENLSDIPDDMDFTFLPEPKTHPMETVPTHVCAYDILYPKLRLFYRPQYRNEPELKNYLSDANFSKWMNASFKRTLDQRLAKLDFSLLTEASKDKGQLANLTNAQIARYREAVDGLLNIATVYKTSLNSGTVSLSYEAWAPFRDEKTICPLEQNLMRLGNEFKKSPEATLDWLNRLNPESRQNFFEFFEITKAFGPLRMASDCLKDFGDDDRDYAIMKAPLDSLLTYIALQVLRQGHVQVIKPQIVSEVAIVLSMNQAPPPPLGKHSDHTTPGDSLVAVKGTSDETPAPSSHPLKVRTEVLYSLMATSSKATVATPFVQLALAKLWSPSGETYFKQTWFSHPSALTNFVDVWDWSLYLNIKDWMSPDILALVNAVQGKAGPVMHRQAPLRGYARVPNYMTGDLLEASVKAGRTLEQMTDFPEIKLSKTSSADISKESDMSQGNCPLYQAVTENLSVAEGQRVKAAQQLFVDMMDLEWSRSSDGCEPLFSDTSQTRPAEILKTILGAVSTQRVNTQNYLLRESSTPGAPPELLSAVKNQSVKEAIQDLN
jgi:hypothetical protein